MASKECYSIVPLSPGSTFICGDPPQNSDDSSVKQIPKRSTSSDFLYEEPPVYSENQLIIQEVVVKDEIEFSEIIPYPFINAKGAEIIKVGYRMHDQVQYMSPPWFVFTQGVFVIEYFRGNLHLFTKYKDYFYDKWNKTFEDYGYQTESFLLSAQDRDNISPVFRKLRIEKVEQSYVILTLEVSTIRDISFFITLRMKQNGSFFRIENWFSPFNYLLREPVSFPDVGQATYSDWRTVRCISQRTGVNPSIFFRTDRNITVESRQKLKIYDAVSYWEVVPSFTSSDYFYMESWSEDATLTGEAFPAYFTDAGSVVFSVGTNVERNYQENTTYFEGIMDFAPERPKIYKLRKKKVILLTKISHKTATFGTDIKSEFFTLADTPWSDYEIIQQAPLPYFSIEAPVQDIITDNGTFPIDAPIRDVVLNEYELVCPTVQERTKVYHLIRPEVIEQSVIDSYFDAPEQDSIVSEATVVENTTINLYFVAPEETFIPQIFEAPEFTDIKSPLEAFEQTQIDTHFEVPERTYIRSAFEAPERTNMNFAPWCVMEDVIFNFKVKDNPLYGYYGITVF